MPEGNPSSQVIDGRAVVTTGGTPVRLSSTLGVHGNRTIVTALSSNTNPVVIGASTVVAAVGTRRGTALAAGAIYSFECDASLLWVDAVTNGEGVSFTVVAR